MMKEKFIRQKDLIFFVFLIVVEASMLVFIGLRHNNEKSTENTANSNQENTTVDSSTVPVSYANDSSTLIQNKAFKYEYRLPNGYLNIELTYDEGQKGIEYSEKIYKDAPRKVSYEFIGLSILVYNSSVLAKGTLLEWIESQTEETFTSQKLYVSSSINSVRGDSIYILEDSNPIVALGDSPIPVIFIQTKQYVYVILQQHLTDGFTLFHNIISTFRWGDSYADKFNSTEINKINSYFP